MVEYGEHVPGVAGRFDELNLTFTLPRFSDPITILLSTTEQIDADIRRVLPRMASLTSEALAVSDGDPPLEMYHYIDRGVDMAVLAAAISGGEWDGQSMEELPRIFSDQKILVLGDDIGSLSEVLKGYGAITTSIERQEEAWKLAKAGRFTENGEERHDVFLGDLYELLDPHSSISRVVTERGPFDVIYSGDVFNRDEGSSGADFCGSPRLAHMIEEFAEQRFGAELQREQALTKDSQFVHQTVFLLATMSLLKNEGMHVHSQVNCGIAVEYGGKDQNDVGSTVVVRRASLPETGRIDDNPIIDNLVPIVFDFS